MLVLPISSVTASVYIFFFMFRGPPRPALFPFTTLFRSGGRRPRRGQGVVIDDLAGAGDELEVDLGGAGVHQHRPVVPRDRKSTRLNSSHITISYAVFCLKKKNTDSEHYCLY